MINSGAVRKILTTALAHTGLANSVLDGPLHFTPHDFRRLFITDSVLGGLPRTAPRSSPCTRTSTSLGYKAV
ncbi:hypothetical protein DEJ43_37290 [Streptomyces venezuelae ATCC 10712]|nr:hypothetical protein vnz_36710 [Streptomyces venezuelae]QES03355.1 hypothetical protein DEJ43_37290 [Streptomyces venezuelae ATCC 10712]